MCDIPKRGAALLFPGVGVKLSGAELKVFRNHRSRFSPALEKASDYGKLDLITAFTRDSLPPLNTLGRQLFTYAFSVGAADVAGRYTRPGAAAGYSFGIYGALVAARVITFEEGLFILDRAHGLMSRAVAGGDFGMGVVLGLTIDHLDEILEREQLPLTVRTNTNHELCHIFSGPCLEIDRLLDSAEAGGALKSQRLTVDIPYHHPGILGNAASTLRRLLEDIEWQSPLFPVISSIDGTAMHSPDIIQHFVADHLATPIDWAQVCHTVHAMGIRYGIECGPGISLSQNARFLPFPLTMMNVKKALKCPLS